MGLRSCRAVPVTAAPALELPFAWLCENFFAWSSVMCGGNGGTSGSVFTSTRRSGEVANGLQLKARSDGLSVSRRVPRDRNVVGRQN